MLVLDEDCSKSERKKRRNYWLTVILDYEVHSSDYLVAISWMLQLVSDVAY